VDHRHLARARGDVDGGPRGQQLPDHGAGGAQQEDRRIDQLPAPTPDLVGKVVQTAPKPGVKAAYGSIVTLYIGT